MCPSTGLPPQFNGCIVSRCRRGDCHLVLGGFSSQVVVIDCDLYVRKHQFSDPICDFLLIGSSSDRLAAAVELKGGRIHHLRDAVKQVQNGVKILEEKFAASITSQDLLPIILHKSIAHREYRLSTNSEGLVKFKGESIPVILGRCGAKLQDIILGK